MGVLAFVAPIAFMYHASFLYPYIEIYALMWGVRFSSTAWDFWVYILIDPWSFITLESWLFIGIRILFPYQMVRYYQGKTTRKRTLVLGVVSDLSYILLAFLLAFLMLFQIMILAARGVDVGIPGIGLPLPIPSLLVVGMLLIRFFPPPSKQDWDLEGETRKWWLENGPGCQ